MAVLELFAEEVQIVTHSQTAAFEAATMWVPAMGLREVDIVMTITTLQGDIELKPGTQFTPIRVDAPDSPGAISDGSYQATVGQFHYRETIRGASKAFLRLGVAYRIKTTGSGQGTAMVTMRIFGHKKGRILGHESALVQFDSNAAELRYLPVADWAPTLGSDRVKAILRVIDLEEPSYLEYQLAGRSANDEAEPNAWVLLEQSWVAPTTRNSERNTGELTLPAALNASSNQLFQLAVAVRKKRGAAGEPRCQIDALVFLSTC